MMLNHTPTSQWTEIESRSYLLHDSSMVPPWRDNVLINKYIYLASQGMGWVARKREINGDLVVEKMVWKERIGEWKQPAHSKL